MKRSAICLSAWLLFLGGSAFAQAPADSAAPADAEGASADPSAGEFPSDEPDLAGVQPQEAQAKKEGKPLSWKDVVVVPRKPFLKGGRLELMPVAGLSVNDLLIHHYALGGDLTYFLTDVFSIGIEGQYFFSDLTSRTEDTGRQYYRVPTMNEYRYSGALKFGYVPVYGKFALFNKQIWHWELFATGGVGYLRSDILPRNPGNESWTNDLVTITVSAGTRFFLNDWFTINFAVRDYIFNDKFEPLDRGLVPGDEDIEQVKSRADEQFVNNVMFYVGVSFFLPTGFDYKTPR